MTIRTGAVALLLGACGGGAAGAPAVGPAIAEPIVSGPNSSAPIVAAPAVVAAPPEPQTPETVFARVRADFASCYAEGKKHAPLMNDGRITFQVAADPAGKTTCVIPFEDTGLTKEVEDCMSARLAKEPYGGGGSVEIPVAVKAGALALGAAPKGPTLDTIEQHGLSDAASVVNGLLPGLRRCLQQLDPHSGLRVVHVGARVGKEGRPECALASSTAPLPAAVRDCAAGVVMGAAFKPPSGPNASVSIPLKVLAAR